MSGDVEKIARSEKNCGFYPACYIAGDCGFEDWKHSNCGLPKGEQSRLRKKFWADVALDGKRLELRQRLDALVNAGDLDHLLEVKDLAAALKRLK